MKVDAIFKNPVCIRLGKNRNTVIVDERKEENIPLVPGLMLNKNIYGFVLVVEKNGKQTEIMYPTQCQIIGIGMENDILRVYEENKKGYWSFDKSGNLLSSSEDDFTKYNLPQRTQDKSFNTPIFEAPVKIYISKNPFHHKIMFDTPEQKDLPLHPGVVFEEPHFGFILVKETDDGVVEIVYPTQNRIDALGVEDNPYGDLKVFENGKYHPWLFDYKGELIEQSSYNECSRRDIRYVREQYNFNEQEAKDYIRVNKAINTNKN